MTEKELTVSDLRFYGRLILEDTNCAMEDVSKIENIMRDDVFHSTLDHLSRAELRRGAHQAYQLLQENRANYEDYFTALRNAFMEDANKANAAQEKSNVEASAL